MSFHDFSICSLPYTSFILPSSHPPSFGLSTCSPCRIGAITGALSLRGFAARGSGRPEPSSRGLGCCSKGNSSGGIWVTGGNGGNSRGFCFHWFSWDHLGSMRFISSFKEGSNLDQGHTKVAVQAWKRKAGGSFLQGLSGWVTINHCEILPQQPGSAQARDIQGPAISAFAAAPFPWCKCKPVEEARDGEAKSGTAVKATSHRDTESVYIYICNTYACVHTISRNVI